MVEIATSLLNVEEENCIQTLYDLEVAHTDYFHIDVMDGEFVKNDTTQKMIKFSEYIKQISTLPIDVHLMVKDVKPYVDAYLALEVNSITFHLEAIEKEEKVLEMIKYIKQNNTKVGLSIKPDTKIDSIYSYLPYLHRVLVMTVEPGEGGQEFMPSMVEKIEMLKEYRDENDLGFDISVDGGINEKTAKVVKTAGADILVAGSAIIKEKDYKKAIEQLKNN